MANERMQYPDEPFVPVFWHAVAMQCSGAARLS
jgi:hypothetical protein